MSLKALFEISIHLERFRNIELFQQGIYAIRFGLRTQNLTALPYSASSLHIGNREHNLSQTEIQQSNNTVCSRIFYIRYSDEIVIINDTALFRLEVDALPSIWKQQIILTAELLFADVGCSLSVDELLELDLSNVKFKIASTVNYSLRQGLLNECLPIMFDDCYCSLATFIVHSTMIDFKFRHRRNSENSDSYHESFANFLFPRYKTKVNYIGSKEADETYKYFIDNLKSAFYGLRDIIKRYKKICKIKRKRLQGKKMHLEYLYKEDQQQNFSDLVASHNPHDVTEALLLEFNNISGQIQILWHELVDLITLRLKKITAVLYQAHCNSEKRRFDQQRISSVAQYDEIEDSQYNIQQINSKMSQAIRASLDTLGQYSLTNRDFPNLSTILIEQHFAFDETFMHKRPTKEHLIVLVHGFQAGPQDMRHIKNVLLSYYPDLAFLSSSSNKHNVDDDLETMGAKLAIEVKDYINQFHPNLKHLSFIGHSMGGLIIRAALTHLKQFRRNFNLYISLCTPHLGYLEGTCQLVEAGMWIIQKLRESRCLRQLNLQDQPYPYLLRLSTDKNLAYFNTVVFISSHQDNYVPFESARLSVTGKSNKEKLIWREMALNILKQLSNIYRLDVNFSIQKRNLDSIIGRAAHIKIIDDINFWRMIALRFVHFFCQQLTYTLILLSVLKNMRRELYKGLYTNKSIKECFSKVCQCHKYGYCNRCKGYCKKIQNTSGISYHNFGISVNQEGHLKIKFKQLYKDNESFQRKLRFNYVRSNKFFYNKNIHKQKCKLKKHRMRLSQVDLSLKNYSLHPFRRYKFNQEIEEGVFQDKLNSFVYSMKN